MPTKKPKNILIAPLDWGLGHTTRCIPIIRFLLENGHNVRFAGNENQCSLIEKINGKIDFNHLEGYNIVYSRWNKWAQAGLLSQLPGILKSIRREHIWLNDLTKKTKIHGIISDNRYGLYHNNIPSVLLTHQLMVQSGFGQTSDQLVQKLHYRFLNRFNETWVVDIPGDVNLGGTLSHSNNYPVKYAYAGLLSQFENNQLPSPTLSHNPNNLLILLSGPEPARTELSSILWKQVVEYNGKVTFVEGSTQTVKPIFIPAHVQYHSRLTASELLPVLQNADIVVCRSGYSTIMDLNALNKKAILLPTPGQTEQEYLALKLKNDGLFHSASQKNFSLLNELQKATQLDYHNNIPIESFSLYKSLLASWTKGLE